MGAINLSKNYRVTSTPYCWMLQKYAGINSETGDQVWRTMGYFTDLTMLLKHAINDIGKDSSHHGIKHVVEEMLNAREALLAALNAEIVAQELAVGKKFPYTPKKYTPKKVKG